jgi:hypothetical protein
MSRRGTKALQQLQEKAFICCVGAWRPAHSKQCVLRTGSEWISEGLLDVTVKPCRQCPVGIFNF